jgi:hypothetical protein
MFYLSSSPSETTSYYQIEKRKKKKPDREALRPAGLPIFTGSHVLCPARLRGGFKH